MHRRLNQSVSSLIRNFKQWEGILQKKITNFYRSFGHAKEGFANPKTDHDL